MGTLLSKDYDGDPYIDLMRSLPERELIWWVQKVIWVSPLAHAARAPAAAALALDARPRVSDCRCGTLIRPLLSGAPAWPPGGAAARW